MVLTRTAWKNNYLFVEVEGGALILPKYELEEKIRLAERNGVFFVYIELGPSMYDSAQYAEYISKRPFR